MKITIIGAGSMGCLYACLLSGKHDVTLIDSYDKTVNMIAENGITVKEKDSSERTVKINIFKSGQYTEKNDLVILFVKDTSSDAAISENIALADNCKYFLTLQNGLGNDEVIGKYVDRRKILVGTTKHNGVTLSPGHIYHSGAGPTVIGSVVGDADAAKEVVSAFSAAGIEAEYSENVMELIWKKLFVNMTINPITAILGTHIGFIAENEYAKTLSVSLLEEAVRVAECEGLNFDIEQVKADVFRVASYDGTGKASMCQDIEHGRKTEIDFINGAVGRLGKKHGCLTPYHDAITQLIHAKEESTKN